jgi:hypothetical protein
MIAAATLRMSRRAWMHDMTRPRKGQALTPYHAETDFDSPSGAVHRLSFRLIGRRDSACQNANGAGTLLPVPAPQ